MIGPHGDATPPDGLVNLRSSRHARHARHARHGRHARHARLALAAIALALATAACGGKSASNDGKGTAAKDSTTKDAAIKDSTTKDAATKDSTTKDAKPATETVVAAAPDSVTGVVSITGTARESRLALRDGSRETVLSVTAADSAALSRLGGIEVMVRGRRDGVAFRVMTFLVRRVEGAPVVDGVVRKDGDRLRLETPRGTVALGNPPAALRTLVGARVWIGGSLATGPNTWGVIVAVP